MSDPAGSRRPRVLFVSNLYPNPRQPTRGIFNRQTVRALSEHLDVRVLAAVPWYPLSRAMNGIPERTDDDGVPVRFVRAFYTPFVLRNRHGKFFRNAIRSAVLDIRKSFPFDLLYGSWVYPDGYGVTLLARELGLPCVLHALGSDIHIYLEHPRRRKKVVAALSAADHVVCVSDYIRSSVAGTGVPASKLSVVYDGVDGELFKPADAERARRKLGLAVRGRIILYVGNLTRIKGPGVLVEALSGLEASSDEPVHLVMVGQGPLAGALRAQVGRLGLHDRVTFAGARPHEEIPDWMSAADVLCLSSLDEGLPNVVLEALASGRPVVASDVGGLSEVIHSDALGLLVPPGNPKALADALGEALKREWDPARLARRAAPFSWAEHGLRISRILTDVAVSAGTDATRALENTET